MVTYNEIPKHKLICTLTTESITNQAISITINQINYINIPPQTQGGEDEASLSLETKS